MMVSRKRFTVYFTPNMTPTLRTDAFEYVIGPICHYKEWENPWESRWSNPHLTLLSDKANFNTKVFIDLGVSTN